MKVPTQRLWATSIARRNLEDIRLTHKNGVYVVLGCIHKKVRGQGLSIRLVPAIARRYSTDYVNQGIGTRVARRYAQSLRAHDASNTMGNSSSSHKISAQDKYAALYLPCIFHTNCLGLSWT